MAEDQLAMKGTNLKQTGTLRKVCGCTRITLEYPGFESKVSLRLQAYCRVVGDGDCEAESRGRN